MNDKVNSNYLNWLIEDVSNRIFLDGNTVVTYKGIKFEFRQIVYCSPFDLSSTTEIVLDIPYYLQDTLGERICVSYDNTYGRDSKTTYMNRINACVKLAEEFVNNVLAKVDFWIKKEVNNMEIDNILEVLEG